jgi:hypothetical protein
MFAAWCLPEKVSREQAIRLVRDRRPDRVYVVVSEENWNSVILALADETEFKFDQY